MLVKLLLPISLASSVLADTLIGCYASISTANSQGTDQYQTPSACATLCSSYAYVGMFNGNTCYCLSSLPSGSTGGTCDVPCYGFGTENCGGTSAYSVYKGLGTSSSSSSAGSSAASSSSGSSSSSSKTSTSSSTSSTSSSTSTSSTTSSSSSSSSQTTAPSQTVVTSTQSDGVVYKTVTLGTSSTSSSTSSSTASTTPSSSKKSSNTGAIAGGVVGGVAGLAIIGLAVFFFLKHRNSEYDDDEEEFYDKPTGLGAGLGAGAGSLGRGNTAKGSRRNKSPLDMPMTNPFVHPSDATATQGPGILPGSGLGQPSNAPNGLIDPRLNPVMMGRRRLSEGSLADEADYSRKILTVSNP